jgi:hypothetical protein
MTLSIYALDSPQSSMARTILSRPFGGGCASSTSPQRPSQSGSNASAPKGSTACTTAASAPKGSTACTTARRGDQRTTADRGHYAAKPCRDVPAFVGKLQADTSVAAFLHPDGVLLGRSPPLPVERDRPCRQDVDDPGERAQDWQKDPRRSCRPAHRRCARRPRANGRDPIERTCLSDRLLGAPIGWTAMPDKVRDLEKTAVVQGFRSSFRDWGAT